MATAEPELSRFQFEEAAMGALFRIQCYAECEEVAQKAAEAAFARIQELNGHFSDYEAETELMRFTREPAGKPVPLSADLFQVLSRAQELAIASDGAFDVTIGPLLRLWRLSRRDGGLPTSDQLEIAFARSGYQNLILEPEKQTGTLRLPDMQLSLGGIAKGYAADEALAVLKKAGVSRALVAASGDLRLGDPPPGQDGWQVGMTSVDSPDKPDAFVLLANAAVSTSGDTQQFITINGQRYSHIVDPKTGLGLTTRRSVTVIAPTATQSDSLATCISVQGTIKPLELDPQKYGVRIVDLDAGGERLFGRVKTQLNELPK